MLNFFSLFVRAVNGFNHWLGRFAIYIFYLMAAILLTSTASRLFGGVPVNWAMEMCQFLLVAYYLLGGAWSMQNGYHVRMDLFYGRLPARGRLGTDCITILFVIFFLSVLLWGGIWNTEYAYSFSQRNNTAWRPLMWPIKAIMTFGVFSILMQCIATFIKDFAEMIGKPLDLKSGVSLEKNSPS